MMGKAWRLIEALACALVCLVAFSGASAGQVAGEGSPVEGAVSSEPAAVSEPVLQLALDAAHNHIGAFPLFTQVMQAAGMQVREIATAWTPTELAGLDVLWIESTNSGMAQLAVDFTPAELEQVARFVASGGALVVAGCTGSLCTLVNQQVNRLLAAVGATTRLQAAVNAASTGASASPPSALTTLVAVNVALPEHEADLRQLLLREPAIVLTQGQKSVVILQSANGTDNPITYGALEQVGRGYVVVLGSSLFVTEAVQAATSYDNAPFAAALAGWLAERAQLARGQSGPH